MIGEGNEHLIPIWGSQLMEKFPIIIYAKVGLLAFTAGERIVGDKINDFLYSALSNMVKSIHTLLPIILVIVYLLLGICTRKHNYHR